MYVVERPRDRTRGRRRSNRSGEKGEEDATEGRMAGQGGCGEGLLDWTGGRDDDGQDDRPRPGEKAVEELRRGKVERGSRAAQQPRRTRQMVSTRYGKGYCT